MEAIQKTNKYDLFHIITSNREVKDSDVDKLIVSIQEKNLLSLNPILVNKNMQVIDGQHRLEAARKLKIDIYYIVSDTIKKEDIARLNSNKKNWKLIDYINYYAIEKKAGFDLLSSFISQNPQLQMSTCINLLSLDAKGSFPDLKKGFIDVSNLKSAQKIINYLNDFSNFFDRSNNSRFVAALRKAIESGQYDHKVMMLKVAKQPRSLVPCLNATQYLQMLQDIYNHGTHQKVNFSYKNK